MRITIEDGDYAYVHSDPNVEGTFDVVMACFYALVGATHSPQNVCDAFEQVAEEIREAWGPKNTVPNEVERAEEERIMGKYESEGW